MLTVSSFDLHLAVLTGGAFCVAGTPLQNNMVELYGLLSFMYPDVFTTPGPFEAAFNLTKGQVRQCGAPWRIVWCVGKALRCCPPAQPL